MCFLYCDLNLVMDFVHQFCSGNTLFMQAWLFCRYFNCCWTWPAGNMRGGVLPLIQWIQAREVFMVPGTEYHHFSCEVSFLALLHDYEWRRWRQCDRHLDCWRIKRLNFSGRGRCWLLWSQPPGQECELQAGVPGWMLQKVCECNVNDALKSWGSMMTMGYNVNSQGPLQLLDI